MQKLINNTLLNADAYLKDFGFSEEQIAPLLVQAEKDLVNELEKTQRLLREETIDHVALNRALHALKGLLFHLGNHALAEKLAELREEDDVSSDIKGISELLFNDD